ncbi:hypothetical protein Q7P37_011108 [Cladosporium fusiforme]
MWIQHALMLLPFIRTAAPSLTQTGTTAELNGIHYFIPSQSVIKLPEPPHTLPKGSLFSPITVIDTTAATIEEADINAIAEKFTGKDDVFQQGFLESLYIQASNNSLEIGQLGSSTIISTSLGRNHTKVPNGPYFLSITGLLHQAYRLYTDKQGAFSETSISSPDGQHSVLPANVPGQSLAIAVPSRLYYTPTPERPLAGIRIGVKDIYDIEGLRTSNGNRAWYHLYPAANATATAVENLLKAGAILVGKMKTSQFAVGETATADWVDYHAPLNPRADGYQDPSSSSAGPAAGIAAYPWLDVSLGSDTGGSIRSPSQYQGVFGNRPSHGLVSLDHAMPLAPELDTAGLLARNPRIWGLAMKALYGPNMKIVNSFPSKILTIGIANNTSTEMNRLVQTFLSKLTNFLSAASSEFNISQAWAADHPQSLPLDDFVGDMYDVITAKQQARLVRNSFYSDYAKVNGKRLPFVNPSPLARWAVADNNSGTIEDANARRTRFRDWLNGDILHADEKTCSEHLLVYLPRIPKPKYRNTYLTGVTPPANFSTSRISVLGEIPDFVVPIGEVAYLSDVTNRTEYLPVTLDFMARKGCDGMLSSLIGALFDGGIVKASQAGKSLVRSGHIL